MSDMWRLFIAIEIPPDILSQLSALQDQLKGKIPAHAVRWTWPEGIHLTLKFLGDVPVGQRGDVERALADAVKEHAPFSVTAAHLGCFPNQNRPQVVWVGVQQEHTRLTALRDAVENHIAPLGYPTEDRAYRPHLTLGRVRRGTQREDVQRVANALASTDYSQQHTWPVTEVHLIRSELKPGGAVYTTLFRAPLHA